MMDRDVSDEFDTTLSLRRFVRHDFVFFFFYACETASRLIHVNMSMEYSHAINTRL